MADQPPTQTSPPAPPRVFLRRQVSLPDRLRLARYRKSPEFGPRVLFFSGGTALNDLSRTLVDFTHNSIHLTTPFDSGGSSGTLRQHFDILAVGDLRSRLMALADRSVRGQSTIFELFRHRLPRDAAQADLRQRLDRMIAGDDPLITAITPPMREIIRNHLRYFLTSMPPELDLRGASIGNLVLVGGYLNNARDIDPVVFLFSKLVEVRGTVRPTVPKSLHLAATLANGEKLIGQHVMTGKEFPPIASQIVDIRLVDDLQNPASAEIAIAEPVRHLIARADVICFPMGSFYSSIVANLLPRGVGRAVAANCCPKIYIPNGGADPEQFGMSAADCVETLLRYLRADCGADTPTADLLNAVLLDPDDRCYGAPVDRAALRRLGVDVIETPLTDPEDPTYILPDRVIDVLLSMT